MSRYNQYGTNYYDPVGSHTNQPSGYSYQSSTTSASAFPSTATASAYGSNYQSYGNNAYSGQQYGTTTGQPASSSTNHAAAALSSLSNRAEYNPTSSTNRPTTQYDNSWAYSGGATSNTYDNSSGLTQPSRTQSNNSPLYTTQSSSTFGRLSVPEQSQSSASNLGSSAYQSSSSAPSNRSYQTAYTQQPQAQPPRYNSPLSAVQAQQHGHSKQGSRGSHQPSPQMAQAVRSNAQQNASRQQSASVEPSPATVDPSQVYDNRAELQRKAQIEAERRRKYEAEQAAKKAEEERLAEEQRKVDEEKRKVEQEAVKKKAEQERKRKAREEKRQSKSAATTLQQMATASGSGAAPPPTNDEEEEMRAMFQKMREFNAKNPAMLAKLWEEERKTHAQAQSPPAAKAATVSAPAAKGTSAPKNPIQKKAPSAASPTATSSAAQQPAGVRPFQKPTPASKAVAAPSQPPAQPTTPAATTSLWPPHKKGQLADATAKWLMSLPQNAGKVVYKETVLNILNTNPSYVQLCESLENLGVKFERSTLARELLKAVPDGLSRPQHAPPKPATPLGDASRTAAPFNGPSKSPETLSKKRDNQHRPLSAPKNNTVNYEAPMSLSDAAREVNSMDRPSILTPTTGYGGQQHSPYFTQSQTLSNGSRPPSQPQPQPPEVKPEVKPEEPPRPPADKEEAARKRTFGDLVDLTAEDSDDEGPPKKVIRPVSDAGPSNGVANHQQAQTQYLQKPTDFKQFMFHGGHAQSVPYQGTNPHVGKQPQSSAPAPLNVFASGKLLADGTPFVQQQQQQQQNAPAAQREVPTKPKGPSVEALQMSRVRGKMLVEPIMRDRVARKSRYDSRTIATDVLLATGRHPDMRGLNGHLNNMQRLLGQHGGESDAEGRGNRSDLSTIRWDIIDPEPPKESVDEKKSDTPSKTGEDADDEITISQGQQSNNKNNTVDYELPSRPADNEPPPKKKRGRPPRQSMPEGAKPLSNGLGDSNSKSNTPARQTSRPATPSSAPTANMSSGPGAVGYSAFRQYDADGNVIKKKGRPFGWKKATHSREAHGLTPVKNPHAKSSSAMPSRLKQSQPQEVEPQYQVYKCEWEGCKSELHNLETLKKHIVKVHAEKGANGRYECLWKFCGDEKSGTVKHWREIGEWIEHVDARHLTPIAWKLGDGPKSETMRTGQDTSQRPAYLNDARGRSVTPVISPTPPPQRPPPETTSTTAPAQDSAPTAKRIGRPPKDGIPKAEREVEHELRPLVEHKRLVGATMERTGCVLASEDRREGFLDDEDFEDEVYGSEHDPGDDDE